MASYYYLMSSLPMLRSDGEMPFTYDAFLEMCAPAVKESVLEMLRGVTVDSNEGPLLKEWSLFYAALRDELVYRRNVRLGRINDTYRDRDSDIARIVATVMSEKNPLEAEKLLLALEFEKLDDLVRQHYFDAAALIGYALKLRLLERRTIFRYEGGKAEFERITDYMDKCVRSI